MATISSLGVGSGLDLGSLVSSLIEAERAPGANRIAFKEQRFTTELSAFGLLRSSLSQFQTSLSGLQSSTAFNAKQISVSDPSVFSATVENFADTGLHQGCQRIENHRLVIYRQQLLADHPGQGIEPGSASARQYYSFP